MSSGVVWWRNGSAEIGRGWESGGTKTVPLTLRGNPQPGVYLTFEGVGLGDAEVDELVVMDSAWEGVRLANALQTRLATMRHYVWCGYGPSVDPANGNGYHPGCGGRSKEAKEAWLAIMGTGHVEAAGLTEQEIREAPEPPARS